MGKPDQHPPDPLQTDLNTAHSLYTQLAARIAPTQQTGVGRRTPAASRPPLDTRIVSLMAELESALRWWIGQARWLLDPAGKIDLTAREAVRCPYCNGNLIAYLRPADPDTAEVVCTNLDHDPMTGPSRWAKADWPWLGIQAGVHTDGRYGARLQVISPDA
jgi:DNA-directed RNA polymerase subunit RPC12/RpoP